MINNKSFKKKAIAFKTEKKKILTKRLVKLNTYILLETKWKSNA